MRNLSAYTPPGGTYPPFISINEVSGGVSFYIREPANPPGEKPYITEGNKAAIVIERSIAKKLLQEALAKLEASR